MAVVPAVVLTTQVAAIATRLLKGSDLVRMRGRSPPQVFSCQARRRHPPRERCRRPLGGSAVGGHVGDLEPLEDAAVERRLRDQGPEQEDRVPEGRVDDRPRACLLLAANGGVARFRPPLHLCHRCRSDCLLVSGRPAHDALSGRPLETRHIQSLHCGRHRRSSGFPDEWWGSLNSAVIRRGSLREAA